MPAKPTWSERHVRSLGLLKDCFQVVVLNLGPCGLVLTLALENEIKFRTDQSTSQAIFATGRSDSF